MAIVWEARAGVSLPEGSTRSPRREPGAKHSEEQEVGKGMGTCV